MDTGEKSNVVINPNRLHLSNARGPDYLVPINTQRGAAVLKTEDIIIIIGFAAMLAIAVKNIDKLMVM